MSDLHDIDESEGYESSSPAPLSPTCNISNTSSVPIHGAMPIPIAASSTQGSRRSRLRTQSSCLDSAFSPDDAAIYFNLKSSRLPRPSCVMMERAVINEEDRSESILGQIHLDLCKYHEMGRFVTEDQEFDSEAAFFHLEQSAKLGILEALLNTAKIYLDLPRDILSNYKVAESGNNLRIGFDYMETAAEKGDKSSTLFLAKAYDTGLENCVKVDWKLAIEWYEKVIKNTDDEKAIEDPGYSDATDEPSYQILARIAEMYHLGGNGIEKNLSNARDIYNEAAEKAMCFGKGRVANKFYMLSETISAEIDD